MPELESLRRSVELGLNVYLGGNAGAGKTTLLRRLEYEFADAAVFARAEPHDSERGVLAGIADAMRVRFEPGDPSAGSELDAESLREILSEAHDSMDHGDMIGRRTILVDSASDEAIRTVFGRYRDTLWEFPFRWIVAGRRRTPLDPASSFFDRAMWLKPWSRQQLSELIALRAREWSPTRRAEAVSVLNPATPLQAVLGLQAFELAADSRGLLESLEVELARIRVLPDRLRRLYDALDHLGPIHAGDPALLDALGLSRSRITQGLRELEELGLVESQRVSRRVEYCTRRAALLRGAVAPGMGSS